MFDAPSCSCAPSATPKRDILPYRTVDRGIRPWTILALGLACAASAPAQWTIANASSPTMCAEEDNVQLGVSGPADSFVLEAVHPSYAVGTDSCAAVFDNCTPGDPGYPFQAATQKLYDDGVTVVEGVRQALWWQPQGMNASADNGTPMTDAHYIRIYQKIKEGDYRQWFVLYSDGNMRLIPLPKPPLLDDVCFGSSVIVGPAAPADRPIAEIASVNYSSASRSIEVTYESGGSAVIRLEHLDSVVARVGVAVNYPTDTLPFATFRSMYVADGNSDVDHVAWVDDSLVAHDDAVLSFPGGAGTSWDFYRNTRSTHNTSAPDIRLRMAIPEQLGVFRSGFWAIDANGNRQWDTTDKYFWLGQAGDVPVAADFDGDGIVERGIFRNGFWAVDSNGNGVWEASDQYVWLGQAGDVPVAADFNGDGAAEMGVYRNGFWAVDLNRNGVWDGSDRYLFLGQAGDVPVTGDFTGDGTAEMGVFRNGFWAIDVNRNGAWDAGDRYVWLGAPADVPVTADVNGDGTAEMGVFRGGFWAFDLNRNGIWEPGDGYYWMGSPGDVPVTGP